MKRKPLRKKDFQWLSWTPRDIRQVPHHVLAEKKKVFAAIKDIPQEKRTFANTIWAFESAAVADEYLIHVCNLLAIASPNKRVREAALRALETFTQSFLDILYDQELYTALTEYRPKKETLSATQQRAYREVIDGYTRLGFDLPEKKRTQYKENTKQIFTLQQQFEKNISDYDERLLLRPDQLIGLPDWFIQTLQKKGGKYEVHTSYDHAGPLLQYAADEQVRRAYYEKVTQRGGKENLSILKKLLSLRQKNAQLLGYDSHAAYVLEEQMAQTPNRATAFLDRLEKKLRPKMKQDVRAIARAKQKETGKKNPIVYAYDVAYYEEKLRQKRFGISSTQLQEYFPLPHVHETMLDLFGSLLGVRFTEKKRLPQWHTQVTIYEVTDARTKRLLGYISFDLYPRTGKYSHMAVFFINTGTKRVHDTNDDRYHTPWATLVGNFSQPTRNRPSLLSHDEVVTLFHEFGHAMHHVLGEAVHEILSIPPTDYIELPSQLFEHWAWEPSVLARLSSHYKTGEPLSAETIEALVASQTHNIAFTRYRQLKLSQFDLRIHIKPPKGSIRKAFREHVEKHVPVRSPRTSYMPARWGHLGSHESVYYGYLWSQVHACAAFERFADEGVENGNIGMQLRKQILAPKWEIPGETQLQNFLGKKPTERAFLKMITAQS